MSTAVVTDSNSGITKEEAEKMGIFLIPMPVIIDGDTHFEGQDMTQDDFYTCLKGGKDVTTSQPAPGIVMDLWDLVLASGYDELVHIPMSSGLSNSCETAMALAQDYDGKVCVVDNHRISVTMRESVLDAVFMTGKGKSAKEIKESLEKAAYDSSIYIAVDTLEYLKKGGRITAAAAALGSVFQVKPILTIQGDKLDAFAKVRGMKKCRHRMAEALQEDLDTRFRNVDRKRLILATAGAGLTEEEAEAWKNEIAEAFPGIEVYYNPLSFSISTHVGPGAIGAGICVKNRED